MSKLFPGAFPASPYSRAQLESISTALKTVENETARFLALDASNADSKIMTYALTDSPVALLSWVVERLRGEGPKYPWTKHEYMTILMVHWAPGIQGLLRLYQETVGRGELDEAITMSSKVPIGVTALPGRAAPKECLQTGQNVVFWREREGGRLVAFEHPEVVKEDLVAFCDVVWRSKELDPNT